MIVPIERLEFFEELFKRAMLYRESTYEKMERWYDQYRGDAFCDGGKDALVVRNITYELIESQVSTEIPDPEVTPSRWSEKREANAHRAELILRAMRKKLPFDEMNDMDERYTYIFGGSVFLVEWDDDYSLGRERGRISVTNINPQRFVGQPGVSSIDKMEYCFIVYSSSVSEIRRKWKSDFSPCIQDDTVEVKVCFYKNEDGRVSLYVFSDGEEIAHYDDYYSRKRRVCKSCGLGAFHCTCERPSLVSVSSHIEELTKDVVLSDGEIIPKGKKLPRYIPSHFPIVIRKNTSLDGCLLGQSDCEFIKYQQEEINKVLSRVHEKLIMSGVYPFKPDDCRFQFDNSVGGKVLNLSPADSPSSFGVIDTTPDISRDLEYISRTYDDAKRILGISDTYQGINDETAISGKAKEIQINQAAGRLESKRIMKNSAYASIDRLVFEFMLAFADEPRCVSYKDAFGRVHNEAFSRYDFLEYDSEIGEYYYDDDYIFSSVSDGEVSRADAWARNLENYKAGVFGNTDSDITLLRYWQAQERAHYPGAKENVAYFLSKTENEKNKGEGEAI